MLAPNLTLAANECYCILWLRTQLGVDIKGDAWNIVPNTPTVNMTEGDVLLFDYGGKGKDHGAYITGFEGEVNLGYVMVPEFIKIVEANYKRCSITERKIPWNDPSIKGVFRALSTAI